MDQALHHDKIQNEVDTEVSLDDLDEVNGGCSVLVVRPITPNCDLVKSATDVNNTTTARPLIEKFQSSAIDTSVT